MKAIILPGGLMMTEGDRPFREELASALIEGIAEQDAWFAQHPTRSLRAVTPSRAEALEFFMSEAGPAARRGFDPDEQTLLTIFVRCPPPAWGKVYAVVSHKDAARRDALSDAEILDRLDRKTRAEVMKLTDG